MEGRLSGVLLMGFSDERLKKLYDGEFRFEHRLVVEVFNLLKFLIVAGHRG